MGDLENAKLRFHSARRLWLDEGMVDEMMKASAALGAVHDAQGDSDKSFEVLRSAVRHSEFPMIGHGELSSRLLLAAHYLEREMYDDVLEEAGIIIGVSRKWGQWEVESRGGLMAAVSFAECGQLADAAYLLERSYRLYNDRWTSYENPRYREIALTRLDIARRYGIDVSTW